MCKKSMMSVQHGPFHTRIPQQHASRPGERPGDQHQLGRCLGARAGRCLQLFYRCNGKGRESGSSSSMQAIGSGRFLVGLDPSVEPLTTEHMQEATTSV
jgi:hypothetical protein